MIGSTRLLIGRALEHIEQLLRIVTLNELATAAGYDIVFCLRQFVKHIFDTALCIFVRFVTDNRVTFLAQQLQQDPLPVAVDKVHPRPEFRRLGCTCPNNLGIKIGKQLGCVKKDRLPELMLRQHKRLTPAVCEHLQRVVVALGEHASYVVENFHDAKVRLFSYTHNLCAKNISVLTVICNQFADCRAQIADIYIYIPAFVSCR